MKAFVLVVLLDLLSGHCPDKKTAAARASSGP